MDRVFAGRSLGERPVDGDSLLDDCARSKRDGPERLLSAEAGPLRACNPTVDATLLRIRDMLVVCCDGCSAARPAYSEVLPNLLVDDRLVNLEPAFTAP